MSDKELNLTNVEDPILKAFTKYKNNSSIFRIKNYMKEQLNLSFSFDFVNKTKISKEINKLEKKKASQENVFQVKLIKSTKDLFPYFKYHNFSNSLFSSNFPSN